MSSSSNNNNSDSGAPSDATLHEKLAEFRKPAPPRPSNASVLFPELAKDLAANPANSGNLRGLFIVTVLKKGVRTEEWYMLFPGNSAPPTISRSRPSLPASSSGPAPPVVVLEVEDADILNFVTGGLQSVKAFVSGRVRVVGDLQVALELEDVFRKSGGVEKAMAFVKKAQNEGKLDKKKAKL
ncbi:hypothetical protein DFJ73DRAFT_816561 [Zopfochytrium polystomum]|nr:hypothetical protein DFJ73DRAFT_816561 [Zopfochytrium polystomum]